MFFEVKLYYQYSVLMHENIGYQLADVNYDMIS